MYLQKLQTQGCLLMGNTPGSGNLIFQQPVEVLTLEAWTMLTSTFCKCVALYEHISACTHFPTTWISCLLLRGQVWMPGSPELRVAHRGYPCWKQPFGWIWSLGKGGQPCRLVLTVTMLVPGKLQAGREREKLYFLANVSLYECGCGCLCL